MRVDGDDRDRTRIIAIGTLAEDDTDHDGMNTRRFGMITVYWCTVRWVRGGDVVVLVLVSLVYMHSERISRTAVCAIPRHILSGPLEVN